jgi:hypothetical protein
MRSLSITMSAGQSAVTMIRGIRSSSCKSVKSPPDPLTSDGRRLLLPAGAYERDRDPLEVRRL